MPRAPRLLHREHHSRRASSPVRRSRSRLRRVRRPNGAHRFGPCDARLSAARRARRRPERRQPHLPRHRRRHHRVLRVHGAALADLAVGQAHAAVRRTPSSGPASAGSSAARSIGDAVGRADAETSARCSRTGRDITAAAAADASTNDASTNDATTDDAATDDNEADDDEADIAAGRDGAAAGSAARRTDPPSAAGDDVCA